MDDAEAPKDGKLWTEDQFDSMSREFKANRLVLCPSCGQEVHISQAPGPKPGTTYFTFACASCKCAARAAYWRFDPRVFIQPPYVKCPACSQNEFGILQVASRHFTRRCRACRHDASFGLPRLRKTVIYLDQHLISNMMKALNPAVGPARMARAAFALPIFEALDRAVQLQVVICPDSHVQERESEVAADFKALERMYEQLSRKVTFRDEFEIESLQVLEHATNWLRGEADAPSRISAQRVVHGDLHGWHDRLLVGIDYRPEAWVVDELRARRDRIGQSLPGAFREWVERSNTSFQGYREEKVKAFAHDLRPSYARYWRRRRELEAGLSRPTPEDLEVPRNVRLLHEVHEVFLQKGLDHSTADEAIWQYFETANHEPIASVHVDALICAALAWQFKHGRRTLNRGTVNDLAAIAHLLPYCDAMFLDNEMYSILTSTQVASELRYKVQLFSHRTRDRFVQYLDALVAAAAPSHLVMARHVYGPHCGTPYTRLYHARSDTPPTA